MNQLDLETEMDQPIQSDVSIRRKRGRGPGKKPALVCTSIRLPAEVLEFFSLFPDKQKKMREVLTEYVLFQNLSDK